MQSLRLATALRKSSLHVDATENTALVSAHLVQTMSSTNASSRNAAALKAKRELVARVVDELSATVVVTSPLLARGDGSAIAASPACILRLHDGALATLLPTSSGVRSPHLPAASRRVSAGSTEIRVTGEDNGPELAKALSSCKGSFWELVLEAAAARTSTAVYAHWHMRAAQIQIVIVKLEQQFILTTLSRLNKLEKLHLRLQLGVRNNGRAPVSPVGLVDTLVLGSLQATSGCEDSSVTSFVGSCRKQAKRVQEALYSRVSKFHGHFMCFGIQCMIAAAAVGFVSSTVSKAQLFDGIGAELRLILGMAPATVSVPDLSPSVARAAQYAAENSKLWAPAIKRAVTAKADRVVGTGHARMLVWGRNSDSSDGDCDSDATSSALPVGMVQKAMWSQVQRCMLHTHPSTPTASVAHTWGACC